MMRDAAMKVPLALKDKSDLSYRVVDFGSAIERMIRACDQQVVELKKNAARCRCSNRQAR